MARCGSFGAWLVVAASVPGCYRTPSPACGFVCGFAGACPDNYTCLGDNRCHLNGVAPGPTCELADAGPDILIFDDILPSIYVIHSTPANGDTNVDLLPAIMLTYNVVIGGVDIGAVALLPEGGALAQVEASLTTTDPYVTITPLYQLIGSTTYQLDVGQNFTAPTGFPQLEYDIQFTTMADTVPPAVTTTPMNGDTNVDPASVIVATFSEPVLGVDATTFVVSSGGPLSGTVTSSSPTVWVFTPDAALPAASTVDFQLLAGITDTSGNPLVPIDYTFVTM